MPYGVAVESVEAARRALAGFARRTPLVPWVSGSELVGGAVLLKCENLQVGGAFKVRGAYTFLARRSPAERARGVVTYSSGNHGRAVALAARAFGVRAVVAVPEDIPRAKRAAILAAGAEVVEAGRTSLERQRRAEAIARETGALVVPSFDDPDVVAGQGTVALEILDELPDVGTVVVPVGGGGLVAGIAVAVKARRPGARVVGVEPAGAAAMRASLDAGRPVTLERVETVADGLKPVRPGDLTFAIVRETVDDVVTVTDDEILDAVALLFSEAKLVVEPSGAAAVAAIRAGRLGRVPVPVVAVVSGGNADPGLYRGWLERAGR
jgi:threonine dehydratase